MNTPSATVLVTGAGGFVGAAVVRALVTAMRQPDGRPVFGDGEPIAHVVALLRPGQHPARLADLGDGSEWSTVQADLDEPSAAALVAAVRPRAVLHLALDAACHGALSDARRRALVGQPLALIFEALRSIRGAHLVTTGSAAVLQPGAALDEDAPIALNPAYAHYARAKRLEEELIVDLGAATGVRWTHLRLFYLFGRHERPSRLLPYLVRTLSRDTPALLSSGEQVRDYTDVDEAAAAYLAALAASDRWGSRLYHVGSGVGITVREFADTVAAVVGRPDLLRFGAGAIADTEGRVITADPRRISADLGWSASDPRPALRRAAAWWLAQEQQDTH